MGFWQGQRRVVWLAMAGSCVLLPGGCQGDPTESTASAGGTPSAGGSAGSSRDAGGPTAGGVATAGARSDGGWSGEAVVVGGGGEAGSSGASPVSTAGFAGQHEATAGAPPGGGPSVAGGAGVPSQGGTSGSGGVPPAGGTPNAGQAGQGTQGAPCEGLTDGAYCGANLPAPANADRLYLCVGGLVVAEQACEWGCDAAVGECNDVGGAAVAGSSTAHAECVCSRDCMPMEFACLADRQCERLWTCGEGCSTQACRDDCLDRHQQGVDQLMALDSCWWDQCLRPCGPFTPFSVPPVCEHEPEQEGAPLDPNCDMGVHLVCRTDPTCCADQWSAACVTQLLASDFYGRTPCSNLADPSLACGDGATCLPAEVRGFLGTCAASSGTGTEGERCAEDTDCAPGFGCRWFSPAGTCARWCLDDQDCPNALTCANIASKASTEYLEWSLCE